MRHLQLRGADDAITDVEDKRGNGRGRDPVLVVDLEEKEDEVVEEDGAGRGGQQEEERVSQSAHGYIDGHLAPDTH